MMRWCLSGLALLALAIASAKVGAAPLDAATCGMLKGEQAKLEHSGVRDTMAKGPEWAKSNLAPEKLEQIKRLLQLDEQLLFRCSARTLVELPADADADPAAKAPAADGEKDATPGKDDAASPGERADKGKPTGPGKKAAPAAKKAAPGASGWPDVPEGTKAAGQTPKQTAPAAAPKKQKAATGQNWAPTLEKTPPPKAKPKPKSDDAYKPPPPNPNVDPFANQPR